MKLTAKKFKETKEDFYCVTDDNNKYVGEIAYYYQKDESGINTSEYEISELCINNVFVNLQHLKSFNSLEETISYIESFLQKQIPYQYILFNAFKDKLGDAFKDIEISELEYHKILIKLNYFTEKTRQDIQNVLNSCKYNYIPLIQLYDDIKFSFTLNEKEFIIEINNVIFNPILEEKNNETFSSNG